MLRQSVEPVAHATLPHEPDYEGVSMTSRDASQKAAAKEATNIFQNHYPEFLVRPPIAVLLPQSPPADPSLSLSPSFFL